MKTPEGIAYEAARDAMRHGPKGKNMPGGLDLNACIDAAIGALRDRHLLIEGPSTDDLIAQLCDASNSDASFCMIQKRRYKDDPTCADEWCVEPGASRIPSRFGDTLHAALSAAAKALPA